MIMMVRTVAMEVYRGKYGNDKPGAKNNVPVKGPASYESAFS